MKKNILLILFLISFTSFSQTLENLKVTTKKMYEASYNMNYEEVVNYTYPKVFETISREDIIKTLNTTFDNEVMRMRLVFPNPTFSYSEIKKINGKSICVINYQNAVRMIYEEKLTGEKADEMLKQLKETSNYKTVLFEKARNSFLVQGNTIVIAIADESTKGEWKFVNYDKDQNQMATSILGEATLKTLGFQ